MFDYREGELPVYEGDVIIIFQEVGDMLCVRRADGEQGYVPEIYAEILAPETSVFQLSFDGVYQGIREITSDQLYQFTIPLSYLSDGMLDLGIHSIDGGITFDYAHLDGLVEQPAPVPVPATLLLFGFGLLSIAGVSRKKK